LCTAAALLEGFDNQTMGVAAPRLIAEFHLSAAQSGTVFSSPPSAVLRCIDRRTGCDHIGRKRG